MIVVSASQRTDIPAFYSRWFMQRVRAGFAEVKNPYSAQVYRVSLLPEDVHAIVFWTKNFAPMIKHLDELDARGLDFYVQYTINGFTLDERTRPMEARVPRPEIVLRGFRAITERYSRQHVLWRYHPITFSQVCTPEWHLQKFAELAEMLAGLTERCVVGFHDSMKKVDRNMGLLPRELHAYEPPVETQIQVIREMARIAGGVGITLQTCAEDFAALGAVEGGGLVERGSCIDKGLLDRLWPHKVQAMAAYPSREQCGCYHNRDLGQYDTCLHQCAYCYAVNSHQVALQRYKSHDPLNDTRNAPYKPPVE